MISVGTFFIVILKRGPNRFSEGTIPYFQAAQVAIDQDHFDQLFKPPKPPMYCRLLTFSYCISHIESIFRTQYFYSIFVEFHMDYPT
jgi:hypothetical protein